MSPLGVYIHTYYVHTYTNTDIKIIIQTYINIYKILVKYIHAYICVHTLHISIYIKTYKNSLY